MYILQKEVRLLRRFSKKVLDEPMGGSGSPESEAGSQTEGTPGGHRQQWHLSSMSREDSEEEENEVSSEVRAGCVYNCSTHSVHACAADPSQPPPTLLYCACENWGIVMPLLGTAGNFTHCLPEAFLCMHTWPHL